MMDLNRKLEKLTEILRAIDTLIVAFSGGVDSTFLLLYARKIFAEGDPNGRDYAAASGSAEDIDDGTRHEGSDNKRNKLLAVTADGPNFVPDEIAYAQKLCRVNDIEHMCIDLGDRLLGEIKGNTPERCYICKKYIFADIIEKVNGYLAPCSGQEFADGTNADDIEDYRSGRKALAELGIRSPLAEAGLTKKEIRRALRDILSEHARHLDEPYSIHTEDLQNNVSKHGTTGKTAACKLSDAGLGIWDKPASACLASRVPYGEELTHGKLEAIYAAELALKNLGFEQVRVRCHGDLARIEVMPDDIIRFYDIVFMDEVSRIIRNCGFKYVSLDLTGYVMGNMN